MQLTVITVSSPVVRSLAEAAARLAGEFPGCSTCASTSPAG
jgi:hypothetical protein